MANIGDLIDVATYNAIVTKINLILGPGDGAQQGYGRTVTSSEISSGTLAEAALMQNLYNDLAKARTHQRGTSFTWDTPTGGLNAPVTGEYIGALAADIGASGTTSDATTDLNEGFLDFAQAAQDIVDDQYDVGGDQMSIALAATSIRTTAWNGTIQHGITVTWTNANERRYFFNSGGWIQFDAALTGGTSVPGTVTSTPPGTKDEIWQSMLSTMGSVRFTRTETYSTGSGFGTDKSNYNISSSEPVIIFSKPGSGVYSENNIIIYGFESASNSLQFSIVFEDNDVGDNTTGANGTPIDESVTGTITSNVSTRTATGVLGLTAPTVTTTNQLG